MPLLTLRALYTRPLGKICSFESIRCCFRRYSLSLFLHDACSDPNSHLSHQVNFPSFVSPAAVDFISRLLDVNDKDRLGGGPNGAANIRRHAFFAGLDWDLLEQKQIEPPYLPPKNELSATTPPASDLQFLLAQHGKESYMVDEPPEDKQKYFDHW
jgi:serine/threonine protein kinase